MDIAKITRQVSTTSSLTIYDMKVFMYIVSKLLEADSDKVAIKRAEIQNKLKLSPAKVTNSRTRLLMNGYIKIDIDGPVRQYCIGEIFADK